MCEGAVRGFIIGWKYIGYVMEYNSSSNNCTISGVDIYLFTVPSYYESLIDHKTNGANAENITLYYRTGNYFGIGYHEIIFDSIKYQQRDNQN